jgi:hypothetical protein
MKVNEIDFVISLIIVSNLDDTNIHDGFRDFVYSAGILFRRL